MREIRSYGSVGVSAGNRRHYPAKQKAEIARRRARRSVAASCPLPIFLLLAHFFLNRNFMDTKWFSSFFAFQVA